MTTTTAPGFATRKVRRSSSTEPSRVAPSSQNEWQRYMPRLPSPLNPRRSRMRSAASTAAGLTPSTCARCASSARLPKYVRTLPSGNRSRVVGVDHQAADAVVELAGDRLLLHGREPARQRHRHRVVRHRDRHPVEGAVAELRRGRCSRPRPGPRWWSPPVPRNAATTAMTTTAGTTAMARRRTSKRLSGAGRRPALGVLLRPVDQPQDRAHALVDQVDAEHVQDQGEHGVPAHEHETPAATKPSRAQRPARGGSGSRPATRRRP